MKTLLLAATVVAALTTATHAAEMWVKDRDIYIRGEIVEGDFDQFKKLVAKYKLPPGRTVVLKSDGGIEAEGLNIGLGIRSMRYQTLAVDQCVSVCALMWLAGKPRYVFDETAIGFHGAYRKKDDGTTEAASVSNAYVGGYLAKLGFGWDAIAYMTQASATEMEWLDSATAKKYDIQVNVLPTPKQYSRTNTTVEMPQAFWGEWCGEGGTCTKGFMKVTKAGNTEGSVRCDLRGAKHQQGEKGDSWALTFKCSDSRAMVEEQWFIDDGVLTLMFPSPVLKDGMRIVTYHPKTR